MLLRRLELVLKAGMPFVSCSLGLVTVVCCAIPAMAQVDRLATTRHSVTVAGQPLRYTAYAGNIPIKDVESEEVHGYMFFAAYRVPTTGAPRPVTFLWQGGPGDASVLMHLQGLGPRVLENGRFVDNPATILTTTDVVFVDAIGAGFSRPTKTEYGAEFYSTMGDIRAFTEFVRVWLVLFDALDAPLFIGGESYGSARAANVAYELEKRGIHVNGVILQSGGTQLRTAGGAGRGAGGGTAGRGGGRTSQLLNMARIARMHGKLAPELARDTIELHRRLQEWVTSTYEPALSRGDALAPADRDSVATQLARFIGMAAGQVDRRTLTVTSRQFQAGLLRDRGEAVFQFDVRRTAKQGEITPQERLAMQQYFIRDLGYRSENVYLDVDDRFSQLDQGYSPTGQVARGANARWYYFTAPMSPDSLAAVMAAARARGGGPPGGLRDPTLSLAMDLNPKLRAHIARGQYDSGGCSPGQTTPPNVEPAHRARITSRCYAGGHMMYRFDPDARAMYAQDIKALIQTAK